MRILQLISSTGYYGAEAVVLSLSQELERQGTRSVIGVFHNSHNPNREIADIACSRGMQVESIPCHGRADLQTIRAIREIVSRESIDAIHSHGYKSHLYAYLAARSLDCPLLATCHGHYSRTSTGKLPGLSDLKLRLYAALEHNVLRRFDRVIAVSSEMATLLQHAGVRSEKLAVISNGVAIDAFAAAAPAVDLEQMKAGRLAVGIVGRLVEGKGHRELFTAAKDILAVRPQTVFFVVGDGPLYSTLVSLADKLGIAGSVFLTRGRNDVPNVYAALDIVALPSFAEGTPMVVIEALAASKAVIASQVGGIPDLVREMETGRLISPGDHNALRDGILQLLSDDNLRRTLGENGHALVNQRYSASAMAHKYAAEYRKLAHTDMLAATAASKNANPCQN